MYLGYVEKDIVIHRSGLGGTVGSPSPEDHCLPAFFAFAENSKVELDVFFTGVEVPDRQGLMPWSCGQPP